MAKEFVERRDGTFYLTGSRVPLSVIVQDFQTGETPESIQSNYPTLSLEQVYGSIAFYLGNQGEVEEDLTDRRRVEDEFVRTQPNSPELRQKLDRAREQM